MGDLDAVGQVDLAARVGQADAAAAELRGQRLGIAAPGPGVDRRARAGASQPRGGHRGALVAAGLGHRLEQDQEAQRRSRDEVRPLERVARDRPQREADRDRASPGLLGHQTRGHGPHHAEQRQEPHHVGAAGLVQLHAEAAAGDLGGQIEAAPHQDGRRARDQHGGHHRDRVQHRGAQRARPEQEGRRQAEHGDRPLRALQHALVPGLEAGQQIGRVERAQRRGHVQRDGQHREQHRDTRDDVGARRHQGHGDAQRGQRGDQLDGDAGAIGQRAEGGQHQRHRGQAGQRGHHDGDRARQNVAAQQDVHRLRDHHRGGQHAHEVAHEARHPGQLRVPVGRRLAWRRLPVRHDEPPDDELQQADARDDDGQVEHSQGVAPHQVRARKDVQRFYRGRPGASIKRRGGAARWGSCRSSA